MNTYSIKTRDGIEITGIPEDVPKDDQRLKDQVAQMRAQGQTSGTFGGTRPQQQQPSSTQQQQQPILTATPQGQPVAPTTPQSVPSHLEGRIPFSGADADLMGGLNAAAPNSKIAAVEDVASGPGPQQDNALLRTMGGVVRGAGPIATGALLGGTVGSIVPGVGTVAGAAAGAGAMGLAQMVGDPLVAGINSLFGTNYVLPTDAIEALFTRIGVAKPRTEAEQFVQTVASGAAQAGGSVALGQALKAGVGLTPSTAQAVGKVLSEGPLQQVLGGAGSAAGAQTAANLGAPPLVQLGAGLAGGIAGSALGGIRTSPPPTGPVAEAQAAGINLMTSDVKPPNTFAGRFAQSTAEKLPVVGTGGLRQQQQTQRINAVRDVLRQFGADDVAMASDDVMRDLTSTRAAALNKWTTAKNEVIDALSIPLERPSALPGGRLMIDAFENQVASKTVPMTVTVQKIDDSIAFLQSLKTAQVQPAINLLDDWKQAIQGQDLRNVELLRKQIGDAFTAPEMGSIRSTTERVLSDIYGAVKSDMTDYIQAVGGNAALNKWQVANKELSKMASELDLSVLKSVLQRGEQTPEVIANMLFSRKRSDVQTLYNQLSPAGKASARAAILGKAAERAGSEVSPDRFASEVKRLGDQVGIFFSGDDLKQVNGLVRVLEATRRAGQAAVMPATGVQAVLPAGAAALASYFGGGISGFVASMGAVAGAGGAARLYESPTVRNILMKIPTVRIGSAEEAALFKRLLEAVQATQSTSTASGGAR